MLDTSSSIFQILIFPFTFPKSYFFLKELSIIKINQDITSDNNTFDSRKFDISFILVGFHWVLLSRVVQRWLFFFFHIFNHEIRRASSQIIEFWNCMNLNLLYCHCYNGNCISCPSQMECSFEIIHITNLTWNCHTL